MTWYIFIYYNLYWTIATYSLYFYIIVYIESYITIITHAACLSTLPHLTKRPAREWRCSGLGRDHHLTSSIFSGRWIHHGPGHLMGVHDETYLIIHDLDRYTSNYMRYKKKYHTHIKISIYIYIYLYLYIVYVHHIRIQIIYYRCSIHVIHIYICM